MALISSNEYLTVAQMTDNMQYFCTYMIQHGWTKNAACGALGSIQTESTGNPGLWQNRDVGNTSLGYGLVQWTPATKYISWAQANGYAIGDIKGQCERIIYEANNGIQWQKVTTSMSFKEFTQSTASVESLAELFELNYERHAGSVQPARKTQARYWFDTLSGGDDGSATVIEAAIKWCLAIAEDDSHGYDQDSRWGPDYDCSSFLISGFRAAGLTINATYTGDMRAGFLQAGFNDVTSQVNFGTGGGLKRGDVCLTVSGGHTGMYIGNSQIVHASINELGTAHGGTTGDQTGREICVRSYYNKPWQYCLRYKSGGSGVDPDPVPEPDLKVALINWIPAA
ncbi:phage tail tip lysozyme [Muricomes intestini]|jgi:hypothetical protein|uniref:phage tail tip lysozyme n=1 Tax=Muricomes intestini TaxID=1796634 RepID=UPI002FE28968